MKDDRVSLASSGARGAVTTVVGQVFVVVIKFLGLAILARYVSPETYGVVAVATAISALAVMLSTFGIPMALAQAPTVSRRAESMLFYVSASVGAILSVAIVALGPAIASVWDHPELAGLMPWFALTPLFAGIAGFFRMRLARDLRFVVVAFSDVASALLAFGAAVYLAIAGNPFEALTAQAVIQPCVQAAIVAMASRWRPGRVGPIGVEERDLLRVAMSIFGINALRQGSRQVIVPILGLAMPAAVVGYFDRAQQIVLLPLQLTVDQLKRVVVPVLARVRDDPQRLERYFLQAQRLPAYVTATLLGMLAALAEPTVSIVLGSAWVDASTVVRLLALGGIVRALGLAAQWLFLSGPAAHVGVRFNGWAMPAQVAITLAGLPWGITGVAVASGIGWALYWPAAVVAATRSVGIASLPVLVDAVRILGVFSLPVALVSYFATLAADDSLGSLALGLGAGMALSAVLALVLPAVRRDLNIVWGLLRRQKRR